MALAGLLLVATVAGFVAFKFSGPATEQANDPGVVTKNNEGEQPAPGTPEAAPALGNLHCNRKEWDQAEAAFTEAVKLDPECAEAHHRRAGCLFNAGKVNDSLPDFDVAARPDPKNAEICKNRGGGAYLNMLRFDEALADLKHAPELDPDHTQPHKKAPAETYARRAYEQAQAKKWEEAVADFD